MKKHIKDDIAITWDKDICTHSGNCVRQLSSVFKPKETPWIQPENATRQEIIDQVGRCPSGALQIIYNESP